MRRKIVIMIIAILVMSQKPCAADIELPSHDSKELMFQDMLMLFLLPHIDKKIDAIYKNQLKYSPDVYPYFITVKDIHRENGFRGFHFNITLDVVPTVGPHIPVGEDRLTYDISLGNSNEIKLIKWRHIKGPVEADFPPNWKNVLKK